MNIWGGAGRGGAGRGGAGRGGAGRGGAGRGGASFWRILKDLGGNIVLFALDK